MLDNLRELSRHFLNIKNSKYRRYLIRLFNFNKSRLYVIAGQRGVGKTTTLIQLLLDKVKGDIFNEKILYIQADHFKVGNKSLYEIAEEFSTFGGKYIAFDEIHKYPKWSQELKSIYDTFPELQVIASGSSALELSLGSYDLSRRAIKYSMLGMSFREFLELDYQINFKFYPLEKILINHEKIALEIIKKLKKKNLKIIPLFHKYLKIGYYPYFQELKRDESLYKITLEQNVHTTIESDLTSIFPQLTNNSIKKIKQLLTFISDSVPFIPNWKKILKILEIGDDRTLKSYFKYLEEASLIKTVSIATSKLKKIELGEKIYIDNPNLLYAISPLNCSEMGTVRETFFLCMLSKDHEIAIPKNGDFFVNKKIIFEIGGKNKKFNQLKDYDKGFIVCDNIESGINKKIPLWLFGFLY
jgi:predicted AAA+ superfamily ATPase